MDDSYVMQEDILFENLTVRETLTYVAMLRLGNTVSVRTPSLYIHPCTRTHIHAHTCTCTKEADRG
jgi:hypothetical protein